MSRTQLIYAGVLVTVVLLLAACAGFELGDFIQTDVPIVVQKTHGLPEHMTLNAGTEEYQAWFAETQRVGVQWQNSLERGNQVRNLLSQITLRALDQIGPTIAGVPVLGPLLPALTGLLGMFLIKRPGDVSKDALAKEKDAWTKEKEAAYNKALEVGADLVGTTDKQTPA